MHRCPRCRRSINLRKAKKCGKEENLSECYYCGQLLAIHGQVQLLLSVFVVLALAVGAVYLLDFPRVIGFSIALAASIYLSKALIKLERIPKE